MKKTIFTLMLSVLTILAYSNDTTSVVDKAVQAVEQLDTSSIGNKIYNDVKSGLNGLAYSLKVGAEHVYKILVRQQVVDGITNLVLLLFGFILLSHGLYKYNSTEVWVDEDSPTLIGIIRLLQIIMAMLLLLYGILSIRGIISAFINPEYGAIKDIINFVK